MNNDSVLNIPAFFKKHTKLIAFFVQEMFVF